MCSDTEQKTRRNRWTPQNAVPPQVRAQGGRRGMQKLGTIANTIVRNIRRD